MSGRRDRFLRTLSILLALAVCAACGSEDTSLRERVAALQAQDRFEESIAPTRAWLESEPGDPEASYCLGRALVATGRRSAALWPLERAAASESHGIEAGVLLAETLLATQNAPAAVVAADRVLARAPDLRQAHWLRGTALHRDGRYEAALEDAEWLATRGDERGDALRVMALVQLERYADARSALRELEGEAHDEPTRAVLCVSRAHVVYGEEDGVARAEALLDECRARHPGDRRVLDAQLAFLDEERRPDDAADVLREALAASPDDEELSTALAMRLAAQGRGAEAESLLRDAAERGDAVETWLQLGRLQQAGGDPAAARASFERALRPGDPQADLARILLVETLVDTGALGEAEAMVETIGEPVHRSLARARLYFGRNEFEATLRALEEPLRLWPSNEAARYLAGRAAERLGDLDRARAEYQEATRVGRSTDAPLRLARIQLATGDAADALGFASRHAANHPEDPGGFALGVEANLALGRIAAARAIAEVLAVRHPEAPTTTLARAAISRAADGPAAAARVAEDSGLDLSAPEHHEVLVGWVEDAVAAGEAERAAARVEAWAAERGEARLHDLRARLLSAQGAGDAAVAAAFGEALAIDPEHAPALRGLAVLAVRRGAIDEALDLYARAARADEAEPEAPHRAAQLLLATGHLDEAEARLRANVARHPLHGPSCNDLAWLLAERGEDLAQARNLAERAVSLDRSADRLDTLGWVSFRAGDADAALEAFDAALALEPDRPSIRYHRALGYLSQDRPDDAREELQAVLALGDFPEREQARARLDALQNDQN
jgi:tetratricopeptide (TPR) repeat protein